MSHLTEIISNPVEDFPVHKDIQGKIYRMYKSIAQAGSCGLPGGVDGSTCDKNNRIIISILKRDLKGPNIWGVDFGCGSGYTALTIIACTELHMLGVEVC